MLNLRSFIATLTTILIALSGLAGIAAILSAMKSATTINDLLKLLIWWFIGAPVYSAVLEVFQRMFKNMLVRWIGIPLYLFAFIWQLFMFVL
jgi:uncharacterized membrane protein